MLDLYIKINLYLLPATKIRDIIKQMSSGYYCK